MMNIWNCNFNIILAMFYLTVIYQLSQENIDFYNNRTEMYLDKMLSLNLRVLG